jgi:hypothetical protein
LLSTGVIIFLILVKPYDSKLFNFIEIFNEACILVGCYLLYEFTQYENDPVVRYNYGWFMTVFMATNTLVNISALIYKVIAAIY